MNLGLITACYDLHYNNMVIYAEKKGNVHKYVCSVMIGMRLLSVYRHLKVNASAVQSHVLLMSMVLVNGIILIVGSSK